MDSRALLWGVVTSVVVLVLAASAGYGWINPADPAVVIVKPVADNKFSSYNNPAPPPAGQLEWTVNYGTDVTSKMKRWQEVTGLKFDLSAQKGKTVAEAELHLARSNTDPIFSLVAATINSDWDETSGCWRYRSGTADWTFPHGDFSTASFGNYGSLVSYAYKADDTFTTLPGGTQGWIAMKLDPALVQAMILDQPGGLMVTDPRGSLSNGNPTIHTRNASDVNLHPQLYIKFASSTDTTPPGAVTGLVAQGGPESGQVVLQFGAASDPQASNAFGYTVRYGTGSNINSATDAARWRIPRPGAPGVMQKVLIEGLPPGTTYNFFVQAYDAVGNAGAASSVALKVPNAFTVPTLVNGSQTIPSAGGKTVRSVSNVMRYWAASEVAKVNPAMGNRYEDGYTGSGVDTYKKANVVWDAGTGTISLIAGRNEVVGCQLIVERLGANLNNVEVAVSDLATSGGASIAASGNVELFQMHYVAEAGVYYPDAAVPLKAPLPTKFNIPDASHNPGGKNQSVWMDLYIPKSAAAGDYTGTVTVTADQLSSPVTINLGVKVSRVTIPDYPTFVIDLNGYGSPWKWNSPYDTDQMCLRYFQMIHKHRATCNTLPYGWSGNISDTSRAPTLSGSGASTHAADWTAFDSRYGRFFDGTAFTAAQGYSGPGADTPVTHFYTTFHEMWPVSLIDASYGFDASGLGSAYWDNLIRSNPDLFFTTAPDLYAALPSGYKQGVRNVIADWFSHAQSKGWTQTAFECYLNNKYSFSGTHSLWTLEECEKADDFRAVGFFHQLYRDGQAASGASNVKWHFRIDISDRWGQNYGQLDNRINWQCVGSSAAGWHWPNKEYRKYFLDDSKQEQWIWYGLGGSIAPSTVLAEAAGIRNAQVFLQKWSQGFEGGLPYWDNYQTSWGTANDLSTVYEGKTMPGRAYDGPVMSIRVKQMRQAQQVIELLNAWASVSGMNRQQARNGLAGKYGDQTWDYAFGNLDELKLYLLHADLLAQLEGSSPRPGELAVSPTTGLSSSGPKGGPFAPGNITYTVSNSSTTSIDWTATKTAIWVSLSKAGGTLAAGASDTVLVTVDTATAAALAPGTYSDTVTFVNVTNGVGDTTRGVSLAVTNLTGGVLAVSPAGTFAGLGPQGGPFTASLSYTLTNTGDQPIYWTARKIQPWVTLSKLGGTLAVGAQDTVIASISPLANNLLVGMYSNLVSFANTTNGKGSTSRSVSLTVVAASGGLEIAPGGGFISRGNVGGPFAPASTTYLLLNTSNTTISWTATVSQPWVKLSKSGGLLAPGNGDAVTVLIDSAAGSGLHRGVHEDTIRFHINSDSSIDRPVSLTIILPGDANDDGTVNILDALQVVKAFGVSQGQSGYDGACDFDGDSTVSMLDLLTLVRQFGVSD